MIQRRETLPHAPSGNNTHRWTYRTIQGEETDPVLHLSLNHIHLIHVQIIKTGSADKKNKVKLNCTERGWENVLTYIQNRMWPPWPLTSPQPPDDPDVNIPCRGPTPMSWFSYHKHKTKTEHTHTCRPLDRIQRRLGNWTCRSRH